LGGAEHADEDLGRAHHAGGGVDGRQIFAGVILERR
jgi:hypothetical protein